MSLSIFHSMCIFLYPKLFYWPLKCPVGSNDVNFKLWLLFLVYTILTFFSGPHSSNVFLVYAGPTFHWPMPFPLFWLLHNKLQLVDPFCFICYHKTVIRYNCSGMNFPVICTIYFSIVRWYFAMGMIFPDTGIQFIFASRRLSRKS
jgi:hypothetical protein